MAFPFSHTVQILRMSSGVIFTFMHLADAFIQHNLHCIQDIFYLFNCFISYWTHDLGIDTLLCLSNSKAVAYTVYVINAKANWNGNYSNQHTQLNWPANGL